MDEKFFTIYKTAEAEIIEKKSKFIATVAPIQSENDAVGFIANMKKKYYNANHNVFAFRAGGIERQSDDGEPGGTAGLPVLNVLRAEKLQNVAVNVTRYFGGVLLGTGGLTRAYGKAAKESVLKAGIIEKNIFARITVTTEYHLLGKIQFAILQKNYIINNIEYSDNVMLDVCVESAMLSGFIKMIADLTGAKAGVEQIGDVFGFWYDGKFYI